VWFVVTATIEIDAFVPLRLDARRRARRASAVALLYAALGAARLARDRLDGAGARADRLRRRRDRRGPARQSARGGGWWAWPIAFAAHALVLRLAAPFWPKLAAHAMHALGAITLALVGALLGRSATAQWGDFASAWPWLGWLAVPAAMLLVLPRPATARVWPVRMLPEAYQTSAAAVLAAGLWLWTLVANVASDGSAAPLPYLPFLNPLDIGIGIALAATLLWLKHVDRVAPWSLAMAAGAGFVWLNAILVRSFHHYAGVPVSLRRLARLARGADRHHAALDGDRAGDDVARIDALAARALVRRRCLARRGRAEARPGRPLRQPDANHLVHRRRRAHARHRLRRAVADEGDSSCRDLKARASCAGRCSSPARCSPPRSRTAEPAPYRYQAPIAIDAPAPFVQMALPVAAYGHVEQDDLRDLRIVDAKGERVPFAVLPPLATVQLSEQVREASLYPLPARPAAAGSGRRRSTSSSKAIASACAAAAARPAPSPPRRANRAAG
jgi:hypothetical protein